jgi:hypothetical protein
MGQALRYVAVLAGDHVIGHHIEGPRRIPGLRCWRPVLGVFGTRQVAAAAVCEAYKQENEADAA